MREALRVAVLRARLLQQRVELRHQLAESERRQGRARVHRRLRDLLHRRRADARADVLDRDRRRALVVEVGPPSTRRASMAVDDVP